MRVGLDPAAEAVLRGRWSRSQRHVTQFSIVWPASVALSCATMLVLAVLTDGKVYLVRNHSVCRRHERTRRCLPRRGDRAVRTLLVFAVAMCVAAHRANRTLSVPVVPELGSADVRIELGVRSATPSHDLVSARIVIDRERFEWSARLQRGGDGCPSADLVVRSLNFTK